MDREELILHWMDIIAAVFSAEDSIKPEWEPRLKLALQMSPDERVELCDNYLRAIAVEILENGGGLENEQGF